MKIEHEIFLVVVEVLTTVVVSREVFRHRGVYRSQVSAIMLFRHMSVLPSCAKTLTTPYLASSLQANPLQRCPSNCVDCRQEVFEQWDIQLLEFCEIIRVDIGCEVYVGHLVANRR